MAKSPLRVCFVSMHFAPTIGGAEGRVEKQARQMLGLGHKAIVFTTRAQKGWPKHQTMDGLLVVRVGGVHRREGSLRLGRLGIWPICLGMLWNLWKWRRHYDVIHVAQLSPLAAMAVLAGKYVQKPVVISISVTEPTKEQRARIEQEGRLMADSLVDTAFLRFDRTNWSIDSDLTHMTALGGSLLFRIVCSSRAVFQSLSTRSSSELASYGFPPDRIIHISGSVDTTKFYPNIEPRPGRLLPERTIICIARCDYQKGVDVLLHAWGRMMHAPDEWRTAITPSLRLIGDGELRPQLEAIAAALHISDSVEFLGQRRDTVELLQQAWGFVLPSRWEGMPNALLEAMACGLPCVATRVSGSEDIVSDAGNGLLVDSERPEELAQAMQRIIQDVELAQRLGWEARLTVLRHYQLIHIVEQCIVLYRRLLARDADALYPFNFEGGADG
jgi:glycosyltransferase involved in cell wall biosynthesis